ncbi:MAG: ABC transporter permease [Lactobacillus sp.]|nr:ABC transporter permease [Lactobacillus sp.]
MLIKLALNGIKSRWKDYLVLFSGLVIASAIFYMFEALATNQNFIKQNTTISAAVIIFQLGSILLAIITLVYILYANSFLMTMRQRTYATYMMLGAKSGKIGQLIFMETLIIGVVATLIGIVVGTGLAYGVGTLLMQRMGGAIHSFQPLYPLAVFITLAFFMVLFLIAAIINRRQLLKQPILKLLHSSNTPTAIKHRPVVWLIEAIVGVLLLATGYWAMVHLGVLGLVLALVTIVLGSYFVFNALAIWVLSLLRNAKLASKGLNKFTIAQLTFRIHDYTRLLSMVSILFALALGAITVGMGYYNQIPLMADNAPDAYDAVVYNPTQAELRTINDLHVKSRSQYTFKTTSGAVYWNRSEFDKDPLLMVDPERSGLGDVTYVKADVAKMANPDTNEYLRLRDILLPDMRQRDSKVVTAAEFNRVGGPSYQVTALKVQNFRNDLPTIKALFNSQAKRFPQIKQDDGSYKYAFYTQLNGLFSGLEFMGFFLGIAFLAMLASCLMFKILSGAANDVQRYRMLRKVGARQKLLHQAIRREVGVLFLLPGILGVIHVLFGLRMFQAIMVQPYYKIWIPFSIFLVLYALYYLITTYLYRNIVLRK